ncbi:hypothetical protein [Blastopirellula marina]|uniref:Uncharacterized protein n=1 Tax=Blastopirellula marina TaxID=124 RepID=A0A2S8GEC3_9BACT|nr:hypothetical protein [Blastopirellula marina]PQO42808.1 hypothetical protein C5Y98_01235 [Blastopirellula marina]PTL46574.1 hypothetical protein C5Y97_01235 [Blastopirellula marina]
MTYPKEHVVETISTGDSDRTLIVNCTDKTGYIFVEIRQQSYGGQRVGWFTQSSVQVSPESLAALRTALGIASALPEIVSAKRERVTLKATRSDDNTVVTGRISTNKAPALRVWHAESA